LSDFKQIWIISRRLSCMGHVAWMGEMRIVNKVLVGKLEAWRLLGGLKAQIGEKY
jgi:hypothetical protein